MVVGGVAASPALAEVHPAGTPASFGSFTNPNGIAVDEATGDVYVADIGTNTVSKFDADGNPVNFSSLGSNTLAGSATPAKAFSFPSASGNPAAIAVDNSKSSSDPSAGDLYVMDANHNVIDKFNAKGEYLSQITHELGAGMRGLGVDARGDVRIDEGTEHVFDGSEPNDFLATESNAQESLHEGYGFAVDAAGDGYALSAVCGCVEMFSPILERFDQVDAAGSLDAAVAVDPTTGHVYLDDQSSVTEWDPGNMNGPQPTGVEPSRGILVSSFGSLQLTSSSGEGGIAVNGSSGTIYVSSPADGKVYVFGTSAPGVAIAAPANVTKTSATLRGTVDPHGIPVTSCEFEYGSTGSYGQHVACEPEAAQIGSGTSRVSVSANISDLQPGVLYHYRLVAPNAAGSSPSAGIFPTAGPGFGIKSFEVAFVNEDETPDTRAGSHPYEMVTNIAYNENVLPKVASSHSVYLHEPDGNFKDVVTNLPPGFFGDPNATTKKCTLAELVPVASPKVDKCPVESQVGELEVEYKEGGNIEAPDIATVETDPVFNMAPSHGVAVQLAGRLKAADGFIDVSVPAGGNSGVRATVTNAPSLVPLIRTRLVIFGGAPRDSTRPLLTMPTACNGPLTSTVEADSYQNPGQWAKASSVTRNAAGTPGGMTGCALLEFPPQITVAPDVPDTSASSGLTANVHISQSAGFNPTGLAESTMRDAIVTLPEGVTINPAGANGLEACSESLASFTGFAEFNPTVEPGDQTATFTESLPDPLAPGSNFCPNGSKIGTVEITTPLLPHGQTITGELYLAAQNANPFGNLIAMYLLAKDPISGTIVKQAGKVELGGQPGVVGLAPGQIRTTFKNTPELPFEDLTAHFFGGERAPLSTPAHCGTYTTQASFTPWDGNGPVNTASSFQITAGPHGAPCPGPILPFNPSLTGGTTSIQAGGFSPFTMTMSRADGEQNLQAVSLKMPPGLSGLLTGVELCPEPQADEGTCGLNSLIGETTVSVGVGADPFSVTGGKVYLTGPYRGAPFGLSIVNPAKAGPYDLGKVVVRAKIEVDPLTAALTVTSDDEGPYKIPTILEGVPLQIQHVNVTITRPRFTFNPTNCDRLAIGANLSSAEDAPGAVSIPFQATNCATLGFAPKFAVSTSGKTSKAKGASLKVKLTYPRAAFGSQANIAKVKVDLPKQLPSRLTTLQKACTAAQFKANPAGCPAASIVGHAKAITPILPVPVEGPAYFVSNGGEAFPNLIVVLQGYGVTIDLVGTTFISKASITSSTFKAVPDVPVSTFELILPQGRFSALTANGNLCKRRLLMPTAFTAQNGAVIHEKTRIGVTSCPKHRKAKKASSSHHGKRRAGKRG